MNAHMRASFASETATKIFYRAIIEEGTDEEFRACLLRLSVVERRRESYLFGLPYGPLYSKPTLVVPPRSIHYIIGLEDGKPQAFDVIYE